MRLQSEILRCAQDDSVVALDDQQIKIEVGLREKRRQDAGATKSRSKLNGRNLFCGLFGGGDFVDDGLGGGAWVGGGGDGAADDDEVGAGFDGFGGSGGTGLVVGSHGGLGL